VRAEIRAAAAGRLILDLAPYCSVDPLDTTMLNVDLPAEVTAAVTSSGHYDIWVANQRIAHGPAFAELSVSINPPRSALAGSWTPILTAGHSFERTISLPGLLPADDEISFDSTLAPEFVLSDFAGDEVLRWIGAPWLTVSPNRDTIILSLTASDAATLTPGRFSYVLRAWNTFHEPRILLAGILLVQEGSVLDARP
jgi:hypothetical protein